MGQNGSRVLRVGQGDKILPASRVSILHDNLLQSSSRN